MFIEKTNNELVFSKFASGNVLSTSNTENIKFEIQKILQNNIKNWAFDKNKMMINFDDYLLGLEDEKVEETTIEEEQSTEEEIIKKYANMYFLDYSTALNEVIDKADVIENSMSFEVGVIKVLKDLFYRTDSIDKDSIPSNLTEEEKEKIILEFANIYGIYDEDVLATMIGAHRLETGYGTSTIYVNNHNCGGIMDNGSLAKYKTFEHGAESFVRNFINISNLVLEKAKNGVPGYDINKSLAYNLDKTYCGEEYAPGQRTWEEIVTELGNQAKEEGILENFCKKPDSLGANYEGPIRTR